MNSPSRQSWQTITIIVVIVGVLLLALGGYLNPISSAVLSPIFSVQGWITVRYQAFQDFFTAPEDIVRLRQTNVEQQAEIARLQSEVISLQQQVTEVEILSALLDFARAQPQNEYKAAAVIFRDPSPFLQYVIINLGSDDDLRRGMPVVNPQGLVGRISGVTANAARVQLITDPASLVNIRIQPSESDAVLQGSITSDLSVDLIPKDDVINPGDLVLTSGLGGNYPAGIIIGQIASVRTQATALFKEASIQSTVDFSRLEIVNIIVNFRPIDFSPLIQDGSNN